MSTWHRAHTRIVYTYIRAACISLKVLATNSDLSLIPRSYLLERAHSTSCLPSTMPCMSPCPHTK